MLNLQKQLAAQYTHCCASARRLAPPADDTACPTKVAANVTTIRAQPCMQSYLQYQQPTTLCAASGRPHPPSPLAPFIAPHGPAQSKYSPAYPKLPVKTAPGLAATVVATLILMLLSPSGAKPIILVTGCCAGGVLVTGWLADSVLSKDDGTPAMRAVSDPIKVGPFLPQWETVLDTGGRVGGRRVNFACTSYVRAHSKVLLPSVRGMKVCRHRSAPATSFSHPVHLRQLVTIQQLVVRSTPVY